MASQIVYSLGDDPSTTHRLNACAYQQSAITTFSGIQYVAFYTSRSPNVRLVTITRHRIQDPSSPWQYLTFEDYEQTTDDGHNTISIGICDGDGTIHVSFDHHCDRLKYRVSRSGLADDAAESSWAADSFGPIRDSLPGQDLGMMDVTYPRFIPAGESMFFECRIGKAGAGSDILYRYDHNTAEFTFLGTYLVGNQCNPYPNGLSFHPATNALHVTWTNRHFIEYEGADEESSTLHKAQAGPNGPENNEGLYHAHSVDGGLSWNNSNSELINVLSGIGRGLDCQDVRLRVKDVPRNSGIMNQEAQFVDIHGGVHVLNRENISGQERWVHYYRLPHSSQWASYELSGIYPTATGPRGKVVYSEKSASMFFILPSNTRGELVVARSSMNNGEQNFKIVWREEGYIGEPLVDEEALLQFGILSILILRKVNAEERKVTVLQLNPHDLD